MKKLSLTGRLIAVVVVCQLLLTSGLTIAAVLIARAELRASFDMSLQGRATAVLAMVRYNDNNLPALLFDRALVPRSSHRRNQDMFEIYAPNGDLLAQSDAKANIPAGVVHADGAFADFVVGKAPYRSVVLRDVPVLDKEETVKVPARVTVVYASSVNGVNRQLSNVAMYVAGASLLLLLAASLVAAWGIRRGLRPLRDLAAQAGSISVSNWDFHPPDKGEMASELAPLAGAIATVLDRLHEAFRQQRDFTSDAAHELKTSAAILKSTLQSLLQKPRAEQEYMAGLEDSLQDCERLEDLLERMLRLARIEEWAGSGAPCDPGVTELTSTCEAAIARIQKMAAARNVGIELIGSVSAQLHADPKDLELIWVNLLENAVQYSPAGSSVVLRVSRQGAETVLVLVEDCGPGLTEAELPHIFERFRRGDPSRSRSTGGFGLGLAICKALVEAYGGRIEAANRNGRGAVVRVQLTVEPETPNETMPEATPEMTVDAHSS